MTSKILSGEEKAGRVIRLLGWLVIIGAGLIVLGFILIAFGDSPDKWNSVIGGLAASVPAVAFGVFYLFVGKALKAHQNWARTAGLIIGGISLLGFPIGTVIGAYILWCLLRPSASSGPAG